MFKFGAGLYLDSESTLLGSVQIENDEDINTFAADYKRVSKLNGQNFIGLTGSLNFIDGDGFNGISFGAGADYYIDNMTSVGTILEIATGDLSGFVWGVRGEKFLDEKISVTAGINHVDISPDEADLDSYQEFIVGITACPLTSAS